MNMEALKLFPYQELGTRWLKEKRMRLLADDMGTGKSAQTIRAADGLGAKRVLIICPSIARITWEREFRKWSLVPNRKIKIARKRKDTLEENDEVFICTFDYATHNKEQLFKGRFELLVVDEAHYLKSVDTKRTQAIFARGGIAHSVARAFYLTGTPMPNYPTDLWPLLYTYGMTTLNHEAFTLKFCKTYEFNGKNVVCGSKNLQELRELLLPIMLRRKTSDVLKDLPKIRMNELFIEAEMDGLTPELEAQFRVLQDLLGLRSHNGDAVSKLEQLEMMAKSISSLRRYCVMKKVKPVCDLVTEELENNTYEKIILFCIHRDAVIDTEHRLKEFGAVSIHGDTSPNQRQKNIDLFQNDPRCRVMVANIGAAGTNITLTAASEVLFIEQGYVPGDNAQAIARAHRIGQKNSVNVRVATLADTIDERVQSILTHKTRGILELMD